jgi:peptide/nickel transport system substrate-binding protein
MNRRCLLNGVGGLIASYATATKAKPQPIAFDGNRRLVVAAPWAVQSAEPSTTGYIFTRLEVTQTLWDIQRNLQNGALSADTKNAIAQSFRVNQNLTEWQFFIKANLRFHDGSLLQPRDVQFCLERAAEKPGPLRIANISRITNDSDSVRIVLKEPFAELPSLLTHSSTQILAPASFDKNGVPVAVIGTGLFKIEKLDAPHTLHLALAKAPIASNHVSKVSYVSAHRGETLSLMAESKQADIVFGLDARRVRGLSQRTKLEYVDTVSPRTALIKLNCSHPYLSDLRVRTALSQAINRDGIAKALIRDQTLAATQLFAPSLEQWHQKNLEPLRYQPTHAADLLRAAGWERDNSGWLRRDGKLFQLILTTFPDRPELPLIATALQEQWRLLGITIHVRIGNASDIPALHHNGQLEIGLFARNYGLTPNPLITLMQDLKVGGTADDVSLGGDWGAMAWRNPKAAELVRALRYKATANSGLEIHKLCALMQTELPLIPIAWYKQYAVFNPTLRGFQLDEFERNYGVSKLHWNEA